ncbi:MAG TPA: helix-turn-helix domain-containing protein [Candidatus Tectomicrobia bacterium]
MTTHDGTEPVSATGMCRATGEETSRNRPKPVRFAAQKKTEAVLRLLRGDDLHLLSRELRAPTARLAAWRDAFLAGGQEALTKHPHDARDREIARLREKLGESTMDHELLQEKIACLEPGSPLRLRRSS